MASNVPNSTPISVQETTLAATHVPRLTPASARIKDGAQTLLTVPTDPLAHKLMAPASAQDQEHNGSETNKPTGMIDHVQHCHFMKLPPELRISIYELVFHDALEQALCEEIHHKIAWSVPFKASIKNAAAEVRRRHLYHLRIALVMLHISSTLRAEGIDICRRLVFDLKQSTEASLDELWPGCKNQPLYAFWFDLSKQKHPNRIELFQMCSKLTRRYENLRAIYRMLQKGKQSISEIHAKQEETHV